MRKPTLAIVTAYVGGIVTALFVAVGLAGWAVVVKDPPPETNPHAIAEQFGVTISWVDQLSCGELATANGCFKHETPDVIYVVKFLDEEVQRSVILHELGHVVQYRLGLPGDECAADEFARSLGATWFVYDCS